MVAFKNLRSLFERITKGNASKPTYLAKQGLSKKDPEESIFSLQNRSLAEWPATLAVVIGGRSKNQVFLLTIPVVFGLGAQKPGLPLKTGLIWSSVRGSLSVGDEEFPKGWRQVARFLQELRVRWTLVGLVGVKGECFWGGFKTFSFDRVEQFAIWVCGFMRLMTFFDVFW